MTKLGETERRGVDRGQEWENVTLVLNGLTLSVAR